MGIQYSGEDDYNREVLIHGGVPEADVRVFPDAIVNTEQEVDEIAKQMRREGKTSVIIVTSREHTRRVKALWGKQAGGNLRAIVRGAPQDPFDADHWWRDTRDVFSVVREILGLLNAWDQGLPGAAAFLPKERRQRTPWRPHRLRKRSSSGSVDILLLLTTKRDPSTASHAPQRARGKSKARGIPLGMTAEGAYCGVKERVTARRLKQPREMSTESDDV